MRATIIHGPGDIRVEDRDYPAVQLPTDAVVKVAAACVCGSDLWPYRGVKPIRRPTAIGHEFIGVVESVGSEVTGLEEGDFVIAPFVAPGERGMEIAMPEKPAGASLVQPGSPGGVMLLRPLGGDRYRVERSYATMVIDVFRDPGPPKELHR